MLTRNAAGRIPELDGLRGLAILLVLGWHFLGVQLQPQPGEVGIYLLKRSFGLGWSGVDLFFVLSGFLIGGILLDHRGSPGWFSTFFTRRVCRIFPLWFAWVGLYVVCVHVLRIEHRFPWLFFGNGQLPLWSYFLYVQNHMMAQASHFGPFWLGVSWSLAIEEQFYLLLPLLLVLFRGRRLLWVLGALVIATPLIRWLVWVEVGQLSCYVLLPCRWDALFIGVLAAALDRTSWFEAWARAHMRWLRVLLVALLAGVVLLLVFAPWVTSPLMCTVGYTYLACFYVTLVLMVLLSRGGILGALFRQRWLRGLGTISYGIYIFHQPMAGLCHRLLRGHTQRTVRAPQIHSADDAVVTLLALVLTIALAWASFRFFESPLIRLGRRKKYASTEEERG